MLNNKIYMVESIIIELHSMCGHLGVFWGVCPKIPFAGSFLF